MSKFRTFCKILVLLSKCKQKLWVDNNGCGWHITTKQKLMGSNTAPIPGACSIKKLCVIYGNFAVYYEIFEIMSKFTAKIWP